jgi:hypothetical protein
MQDIYHFSNKLLKRLLPPIHGYHYLRIGLFEQNCAGMRAELQSCAREQSRRHQDPHRPPPG